MATTARGMFCSVIAKSRRTAVGAIDEQPNGRQRYELLYRWRAVWEDRRHRQSGHA